MLWVHFYFCLLFWLNVDRTLLQNMCTLFKCINTTQVLVISPVSFQSSDWKQLSICFLSYYSWFNYLIKLIFTIKYLFLIILFLFIFIFLFRMVRSQQFFGQNTHTHRHTLSFIYVDVGPFSYCHLIVCFWTDNNWPKIHYFFKII